MPAKILHKLSVHTLKHQVSSVPLNHRHGVGSTPVGSGCVVALQQTVDVNK